MGYVSILGNARAGAQQSIDPIVASAQSMARQMDAGRRSGGPYTLNRPGNSYTGGGCTCGACPVHSGAYGGGAYGDRKRMDGSTSYGMASGYAGGGRKGYAPSAGYAQPPTGQAASQASRSDY